MTKTATAHERPILTVDVALLALIDQRLPVADLRDVDWAELRRLVRLHHVDIGAVRALLHG